MSNSTNLLFVGLPKSGKTTYLAALWHVLEDQSSPTRLRRRRNSGDRTYLNLIAEAWRACTPVPRTSLQTDETTVALHLEGDGFGEFTLTVPDLGGEAFEQQLEHRKMSAAHEALFREANGVLLFTHPDVAKGTQISEQHQIAASIGGATEAPSGADVHAAVPLPWKAEMLPTQAKLVELLQFLLEMVDQRRRVAVVVSAWDLVSSVGQTPREYVSGRMPLLRQFLVANDDVFDHAVFGVSAQGGAIPDDKTRLLGLDSLKRIQVCHESENDHDITKPLAWLLGSK
ncbi:MAG: hypothetical protein K8T90_09075 [Planctomycetes bacterium]|nr:hypothetical protein [Planctomycetota bacterium]